MTFLLRSSDGGEYDKLRNIRFSRSIDELVSILDVEMILAAGSNIDLTGTVQLYHDNKLIFTGQCFADNQIQADETQMQFQFRSKSFNLARCMHLGAKTFNKSNLSVIVDALLKPFGVKVSSIVRNPKVEKFAIDSTETVFDALDKLIKDNGLLMIDTPSGDIAIIDRNVTGSSFRLQLEKNIQSFEYGREMQEVFSEIHVISETEKTFQRAIAKDPNAIGYSPLVIKSAKKATLAELQAIANFEVAVRSARASSMKLAIPAASWVFDGQVVDINRQVNLNYPDRPDFNGIYMIKSVNLGFSENEGHTVELTLAEPNEFLAKPEVAKKPKTKKTGKASKAGTLKIINP
jgi:prophage tail gpP-like protein